MKVILLGLILALTTNGTAFGRDRGHGGRWMEKLNLTEEQKPKVKISDRERLVNPNADYRRLSFSLFFKLIYFGNGKANILIQSTIIQMETTIGH